MRERASEWEEKKFQLNSARMIITENANKKVLLLLDARFVAAIMCKPYRWKGWNAQFFIKQASPF